MDCAALRREGCLVREQQYQFMGFLLPLYVLDFVFDRILGIWRLMNELNSSKCLRSPEIAQASAGDERMTHPVVRDTLFAAGRNLKVNTHTHTRRMGAGASRRPARPGARTLVLAVDDSPEAAVAFSWVRANVLRPSDSLALVHVHDPGVGEEQARRKVAKLEELCHKHGIPVPPPTHLSIRTPAPPRTRWRSGAPMLAEHTARDGGRVRMASTDV